jgi:hypothetical protein
MLGEDQGVCDALNDNVLLPTLVVLINRQNSGDIQERRIKHSNQQVKC